MITEPSTDCAVYRHVPYVHVASVADSLDFYARLGFTPASVLRDHADEPFWAMARSSAAEIMLARASGPIDAHQQAVLFYMYSRDVAGLRRHLLAVGLHDAGRYTGKADPAARRGAIHAIQHPPHMPQGELRLIDPDGYVILIGQLEPA